MTFNTILFEKKDGYAKITLNRPDVLNSFNEEMHLELRDALNDCQKDDQVRAILLAASGRGFCAGQDLWGSRRARRRRSARPVPNHREIL